MTVENLHSILSPPFMPKNTGDLEGWHHVERGIGTVLPQDYKDYIATYGEGSIANFIQPFNPFSNNSGSNFELQLHEHLASLREVREWGEHMPYPLYPEQGGLLPWGGTANGDTLFWVTSGQPDTWPVVINGVRSPDFEIYRETMTEFLYKLLMGEITTHLFPKDWKDGDVSFR